MTGTPSLVLEHACTSWKNLKRISYSIIRIHILWILEIAHSSLNFARIKKAYVQFEKLYLIICVTTFIQKESCFSDKVFLLKRFSDSTFVFFAVLLLIHRRQEGKRLSSYHHFNYKSPWQPNNNQENSKNWQ